MPNNDSDPQSTEAVAFLKDMVAEKAGGETRAEQLLATETIERSIKERKNLLLQAGTGTGKTFSYLIPSVLACQKGKKLVIATATKQLSEQILKTDIPVVKAAYKKRTGKDLKAELLKGRENYACHYKFDALKRMDDMEGSKGSLIDSEELASLDSAFADQNEKAKEYASLYGWLDETKSGDRTDAPAVSDDVWKGISSNNFECIGAKKCPFASECFSEMARKKAKAADIVVTNHAIMGHDFMIDDVDNLLLGQRDFYIADEVHELEDYLTGSWSQKVTVKMLSDAVKQIKSNRPAKTSQATSHATVVEELNKQLEIIEDEFLKLETGLFSETPMSPKLEKALYDFRNAVERSCAFYEEKSTAKEVQTHNSNIRIMEALLLLLWDNPENIRSSKAPRNEWDKEPVSIKAEPLRIGPKMMSVLAERDAFFIGTSATITVGGNFDSAIRQFALDETITDGESVSYEPRDFDVLDVGTPFDYKRQAMMYIPDERAFPSPEYKTIKEHSEATTFEMAELIKASNGSALVLTTTTKRIKELKEELTKALPRHIKVFAQGDAPNANLIDDFKADKHAVLIGTMGFWQGVDAQGDTCILVCIDKIPFATGDDPLMKARKKHVDDNGGNGFMEVALPAASRKLSQAMGRLVRSKSDRGVVAFFDTRVVTKRYGSAVLRSVPPMNRYKDLEVVKGALRRLSGQE